MNTNTNKQRRMIAVAPPPTTLLSWFLLVLLVVQLIIDDGGGIMNNCNKKTKNVMVVLAATTATTTTKINKPGRTTTTTTTTTTISNDGDGHHQLRGSSSISTSTSTTTGTNHYHQFHTLITDPITVQTKNNNNNNNNKSNRNNNSSSSPMSMNDHHYTSQQQQEHQHDDQQEDQQEQDQDQDHQLLYTCEPKQGIEYMSQFYEDQTIIKHYFQNNKKNCGGTIVEMGGYNGKTFSNSWYFQYALGWRTLLAEALPDNYVQMKDNRPDAINIYGAMCWDDNGIDFQITTNPATGGTVNDMSTNHYNKWRPKQQQQQEEEEEEEETTTVVTVPCHQVTKVLLENNIKHVDVFFLDVEGGELTVLETIDWSSSSSSSSSVQIDIFVIEMDGSNPFKENAVRELLLSHNYVIETTFNIRDECKLYKKQHNFSNDNCMPSEIFILKHVRDEIITMFSSSSSSSSSSSLLGN